MSTQETSRGKTTDRSARARRTEKMVRRAIVLELLRGWTIPLTAIIAILAVWLLSSVNLLAMQAAVQIAAAAALVAALHTGLADFADGGTSVSTVLSVLAFSALLLFATLGPLHELVAPGQPVATVELAPGKPPIELALGGAGGSYHLFLDGHLTPTQAQVSRSVPYELKATVGQDDVHLLAGEFSDRWGQRRLGRRGSTSVHLLRTSSQHLIGVPDGAKLALSLESIGAEGRSVTVGAYRSSFPTWLFVGLGAALTGGALLIDFWRETSAGELLLTSVTLSALLSTALLRRIAPPHPGLGDLVFNGGVGTVAGILTGAVLGRGLRVAGVARRGRG